MRHFVEENIGFNLEIAFIEYFLCKTVFSTKTNTLYITREIAPIPVKFLNVEYILYIHVHWLRTITEYGYKKCIHVCNIYKIVQPIKLP